MLTFEQFFTSLVDPEPYAIVPKTPYDDDLLTYVDNEEDENFDYEDLAA